MDDLYHTDYHRWIIQQREKLQNNQFGELDKSNLLEAMTLEMGNLRHTLESHLTALLLHLLKYQYQTQGLNPLLPEPYNCRDWFGSIDRSRDEIQALLRKNPSLQRSIEDELEEVYPRAKKMAIKEMNRYVQKHQLLDKNSFPEQCAWSFQEIVGEDWLPS